MADATETLQAPGEMDTPQRLQEFVPTPERLSQFLEVNKDAVVAQLVSLEGREKLFAELMEHGDDLQEAYPNFDAERVRSQLELVGQTLLEKQEFLNQVSSPEKKGFLRRTWETLTSKPVIITLLLLALLAGGFYLSRFFPSFSFGKIGNFSDWWKNIQSYFGVQAAEVAQETAKQSAEGVLDVFIPATEKGEFLIRVGNEEFSLIEPAPNSYGVVTGYELPEKLQKMLLESKKIDIRSHEDARVAAFDSLEEFFFKQSADKSVPPYRFIRESSTE